MKNGLYPFFWQHGEDHAVLSEYMDKIAESGMKGVCIEARPHPDFVGDQWWSDLDLILAKAKENEMKVWILDDSHRICEWKSKRMLPTVSEEISGYASL